MIIAQSLAHFHSYFEELQKAKEKKDFKSNCGYCGGAGRLILPSCPPKFRLCPNCNKKEEMGASDVEKAKEELRREIASCKYVADSSDVVLEGLFNKAKNLLNALDSQKEPELRDKKSCLSERETKLPWKDVSELLEDEQFVFLKDEEDNYTFGHFDEDEQTFKEFTGDASFENPLPQCAKITKYCTFNEVINSIESMLSRQDELEARVRKLEGK